MGLVIAILFSIFFILFVYYVFYPILYWKWKGFPYAGFSSTFYALRAIFMNISMGNFLWKIYESNDIKAKAIGFHLFSRPCVVLKDLDLIKKVLVKDYENFQYRTVEVNDKSDPIGTRVLFFLRNPPWEFIRRKFSHSLTTKRFHFMYDQIDFVGDNLVKYITNLSGKKIDGKDTVQRYSTDLITLTAFGIKANSFEDDNAISIRTARTVFEATFYRGVKFMSYFISPFLTRIFNINFIHRAAIDVVTDMMKHVGNHRQKENIVKDDFVGIMLDMLENKTYLEGEHEIYGQGIQFWLAGFETIGSSVLFLFYELAHHPNIQEKLREEILKTLKAENGKISYETINAMKYLAMVTTESLRKYPILPFLDRRCINDYEIPDTNLTIEAGSNVYISLLGVHYDPQHFPDPYKFDPERFAKGSKGLNEAFNYLPFGAGRRHCIGLKLGKISVMLAAVKVLSKFRIHSYAKYSEVPPFDNKGFLLNPKEELHFRFEEL